MGTVRQAVLTNAIAEGMSISEAGRLAGYRSPQNAHDVYRNLRDRLADVMDGVGLTERVIAERIREQLYATKTVTASFMGQITDSIEIADNQAIGKAIETAARIRGMVDVGDSGTHIGTVNILWAGHAPGWAQTKQLSDGMVTESVLNQQPMESVPISTVEGTGPDPAPSAHTHSKGSSGDGVLTQRVGSSGDRSSPPQRVVKKRGPRLPVLGGRNKR